MERLKRRMTERGLEGYFERMKHLARNAIHVEPVVMAGDELPVGASKFGGLPDLPEGFVWPRQELGEPLLFLCQFNLAELAPYDRDGLLPKEGLLSFFYDVEAMPNIGWNLGCGWEVTYHVGQLLKRQRGPDDLPGYFLTARPQFLAGPELPFLYSGIRCQEPREDEETKKLRGFTDRLAVRGDADSLVCTKLLGHACSFCAGGMEQMCQRIRHRFHGRNDTPEDPHDTHKWINLLQLDSHSDVGWIWECGYGRVYFLIEEEDLKNCRFDRVIVDTESR